MSSTSPLTETTPPPLFIALNGEWRQLNNKANIISDHGGGIVKAAGEGDGIALLPEWGIEKELSEKELQVINLSDTEVVTSGSPWNRYLLTYIKPKYQIQKVKVTMDFLIRELGTG